jgi:hypothetical protein
MLIDYISLNKLSNLLASGVFISLAFSYLEKSSLAITRQL